MKIKGKQISNNTITESKLNLSKLTINSVTDNSVVLNIQGVNGQLFSINDTLVGDLFTVSDISGMPILNVNSDENVDINGNLNLSGSLKNLNGDLIFTDNGGTYTLSQIINNPTTIISTEVATRSTADVSLSNELSITTSIAKGAQQAIGFANYSAMVTYLLSVDYKELNIGQSIYINTIDVPDIWISEQPLTPVVYTYTTDNQLISDVNSGGGKLQIGYTSISFLETQKVDLTNYTTTSALSTAISTEASNRISTEYVLSNAISKETESRITSDNTLTSRILTEEVARSTTDVSLSTRITAEMTSRISTDYVLSNAISKETESRISSDLSLSNVLGLEMTSRISIESSERISTDLRLASEISRIDNASYNEAASRISSDLSLATEISDALFDETSSRVFADEMLSTAISTEEVARSTTDVSLVTEISRIDVTLNNGTFTTPTYITTNYTPKLAGFAGAVTDIKDFDMTNGGLTANYGFFYAAYNADNKPNPDATWIQGIKFPMANNPDYSQLIVSDGNNIYYGSEGKNVWSDWKTFVMQNDNVNFSKITVNNVGKIYFDGYGGELALATHSYGAYLDVNNSSNALYIRNANNSYSNIATFSSSVNTIGNTTLFGNGSNTKVSISDGGYIGIDSINTNDNLIIRAKGTGGVLMNYGVSGSHVGFYDGTSSFGYINASETYLNNNLIVNGTITFNKKYKEYKFTKGSAGWVRIAKLITPLSGEAYGTISLTNTYYNNEPSSLTFSFGTNYRTNSGWVTQIGANTLLFTKIRIVAPAENNTDYYIELYYDSTSVNNVFKIALSNDYNVELYSSFTEGSIPSTYVSREYHVNQFGISTHSVLVGNVGFNTNRIEVNDNGYLSLTTQGNELTIGKTAGDGTLYINYRQPKTGSAPTTYIWNNGTSTGYADHQVGSLTANEIRFKSNYTTNYISGDGYGMTFSGSQYVFFAQSQLTYFSSQIIARGGITTDTTSSIYLNKNIKVDGLVEFKNTLRSVDTGILGGNTAFQIRGTGDSDHYTSGIAFDTFNVEYPETAYSYKERMRIFSNGNVAIGSDYDIGYKLVVSGSTYIEDGLVVSGTTYIKDGLNVEANTILYGNLSVIGDGYIQGGLNVVGNTTLYSTLSLNSGINITGPINVSSTSKVNNLNSDRVDGYHFWSGTQSQYNAITPKDGNTIYFII